jgi:hypothetical protein
VLVTIRGSKPINLLQPSAATTGELRTSASHHDIYLSL